MATGARRYAEQNGLINALSGGEYGNIADLEDQQAAELAAFQGSDIARRMQDPTQLAMHYDPTLVGEQYGQIAETDPEWMANYKGNLADLQSEVNNGGFSADELAKQAMIDAQDKLRRRAADQTAVRNTQSRGLSSSGVDTAAGLVNASAGANDARIAGLQSLADAVRAKDARRAQASGMAIQGQQVQQAKNQADQRAAAEIAMFNANNSNQGSRFNERGRVGGLNTAFDTAKTMYGQHQANTNQQLAASQQRAKEGLDRAERYGQGFLKAGSKVFKGPMGEVLGEAGSSIG